MEQINFSATESTLNRVVYMEIGGRVWWLIGLSAFAWSEIALMKRVIFIYLLNRNRCILCKLLVIDFKSFKVT